MNLDLPKASDSFVCKFHGLRLGTPKEGPCTLCRLTCEGCGGTREFPHLDPNAGSKFDHEDPHKDCNQKTDGFWMKTSACDHQCSGECRRSGCNCKCGEFHEADEPDAMLLAKDAKYD
jgi:hypothetical protein